MAAVAALFGLVIGSFLNVVIHRLPIMLDREWRRQCQEFSAPGQEPPDPGPRFNLATPASACPACSTPIRARHNVPVLGWLWLRGRCAACGERIAVRYPLVEAFTGLVTAAVALRYGLTVESAALMVLCWALIALSGIDLDHQLLPDVITLPLMWLGIVMALAGERLGLGFGVIPDLEASVLGAVAGYVSLWSVYQLHHLVTGKEGLGYGDFKLLAALGAWLGWQVLHVIILMSSLVGATVGITMIVALGRDRSLRIPFGPYLAAAGLVTLLWGRQACQLTSILCPFTSP
ncbi:MAG: prepilin peptidase [Gammaproteobacteria bacterium]|nr:prepilin peptidase [Gammaproteobacteria bacterium]